MEVAWRGEHPQRLGGQLSAGAATHRMQWEARGTPESETPAHRKPLRTEKTNMVSKKAQTTSHGDGQSKLQRGCFSCGRLYIILREWKQARNYLTLVHGFLERHQRGWLANPNTNNQGGGGWGRRRRAKGEQSLGMAGWSATYPSLSKVASKINLT